MTYTDRELAIKFCEEKNVEVTVIRRAFSAGWDFVMTNPEQQTEAKEFVSDDEAENVLIIPLLNNLYKRTVKE